MDIDTAIGGSSSSSFSSSSSCNPGLGVLVFVHGFKGEWMRVCAEVWSMFRPWHLSSTSILSSLGSRRP